jgi:hypothetical protein
MTDALTAPRKRPRLARRDLSAQEVAFIHAMADRESPTRFDPRGSALAVGLAADTGYKLARRPLIRTALERRLRKNAAGTERILSELEDVATADWRHFITVKRDSEGNEVEVKLDLKDRNKAGELVLRARGAFNDPVKSAVGELILAQLKLAQSAARGRRSLRLPVGEEVPGGIVEAEVLQTQRPAAEPLESAPFGAPTAPNGAVGSLVTAPLPKVASESTEAGAPASPLQPPSGACEGPGGPGGILRPPPVPRPRR